MLSKFFIERPVLANVIAVLIMKKAVKLQNELLALVEKDAEVFAPLAKAYGMAKNNPMVRALGCSSFFSLDETIEMKTMLSIPKTISRKVSVISAIHVHRFSGIVGYSVFRGIDPINVDIGAGRKFVKAIAVENQRATRFYPVFELLERRLVQDNSRVVMIQYRRTDPFVA